MPTNYTSALRRQGRKSGGKTERKGGIEKNTNLPLIYTLGVGYSAESGKRVLLRVKFRPYKKPLEDVILSKRQWGRGLGGGRGRMLRNWKARMQTAEAELCLIGSDRS